MPYKHSYRNDFKCQRAVDSSNLLCGLRVFLWKFRSVSSNIFPKFHSVNLKVSALIMPHEITVNYALLWSYLMYKQIIRISISRVVFAWDRFRCYFTPFWFMMTSSNGKFSALPAICAGNSPVTGEFSSQMPVTLSFDIFFDLRLKKT